MNKSISTGLLALVSIATAGAAMAQGDVSTPAVKTIEVAATNPQKPLMSHQVATLMQSLQSAQAQHRRSGQAQDLARVQALRSELASRGFGRVTQSAPVQLAETTVAMQDNQSAQNSLIE